MYRHTFVRHKTREVKVGDKVIGGNNPIWVQSETANGTLRSETPVPDPDGRVRLPLLR